ncbi:MAG: hypothetical protein NT155_01380 [Candidatus Staskawiczbacteria bacterium]|nr:hypothetical protein [Candidatus Staskawiczbacteria bacterium]
MMIGHLTPTALIELVELGMASLVEKCKLDRNYGYFTVMDTAALGRIKLICEIGVCPPEKAEKYRTFSQEKAVRLFVNSAHDTSWQTRNPGENKWAGAVRAGSLIFSFSGLPELDDEALMTFVASQAGLIDRFKVIEIASISRNKHIYDILSEQTRGWFSVDSPVA